MPPTPAASGDPVLLAAGTSRPAGRAATSPCRASSTRCRARSRSRATPSRTTATPTSSPGCFDPSWGRHKARTKPAVGDHEYCTPGAPRLLRLLRLGRGRPRQGLVQLRPRRLAHRGAEQQLRRDRWLWARDPSSTNGSSRTWRRTPATASAPTGTIRARAPARCTAGRRTGRRSGSSSTSTAPNGCSAGTTTPISASLPRPPTASSTANADPPVRGRRGGTMHYRSGPAPEHRSPELGGLRGAQADPAPGELRLALHRPGRQELHRRGSTDCSPAGRARAARHDDRFRAVRLHRRPPTASFAFSREQARLDLRMLARRRGIRRMLLAEGATPASPLVTTPSACVP